MTINLQNLSPQKQFLLLEDLRILSQSGFKAFSIAEIRGIQKIKMKKGGTLNIEIPPVLNDVLGMTTLEEVSLVKLNDGSEIRYDEWLINVANSETAAQDIGDLLNKVMVQPLSNYYFPSQAPRYPDLLAEITELQDKLQIQVDKDLDGVAIEVADKRQSLLGRKVKALELTDITEIVKLTQDDLKALYEANMGPFDLESTGLNPEKHSISEVSALRVIKDINSKYKVLHFHAFCSPERPEYADYLAAKDSASPLPYDREKYEYKVSLDALAVTDTRYVRPDPNDPITKMYVSGKEVTCIPFYQVREEYEKFRKGINQTAYNAPFDLPFQRKKVEHIEVLQGENSIVVRPESAVNPAHYICQMLLTMRQIGQWPANNLDNAYRVQVDPSFKGRNAHLGFEDNVMLIQITSALLKKYGKSMSVVDIYSDVIKGVDTNSSIVADSSGNIKISFSKQPQDISDKANKLWEFFTSLNEARIRSPRIPKNINSLAVDGLEIAPQDNKKPFSAPEAGEYSVTVNAENTSPLIFSLLRKLMMYDDVLDKNLIEKIAFYDSASRADISLRATSTSNGPTEEDVPLGSFRLNYQYLASHLDNLQANIQMIKEITSMKNVGLVSLADDKIEIKSFQRSFGKVIFNIPEGTKPSDHLDKMLESIKFLSGIGGIPGVINATEEWQEDEQESGKSDENKDESVGVIETKLSMQNPDSITMELSTPLTQCLLHARQGIWPAGITATTTKANTTILEGTKADFKGFEYTIKDMSWLLHRVSRLTGTHRFSLAENGIVTLHQDWGTEVDAMQILERAGIDFKATKTTITLDINKLMKDAYRYSSSIEEATDFIKTNADKSAANRLPTPKHLVYLNSQLWNDKISSAQIDSAGRAWITMPTGDKYELSTSPEKNIELSYDDKEKVVAPLSTIVSSGHVSATPALSSYVISVKADTSSTKGIKDLWKDLDDSEKLDCVYDQETDTITMAGAVYKSRAASIKKKSSLTVSEIPSDLVQVVANPLIVKQLWQTLENEGLASECQNHGEYITMKSEVFEATKNKLIPLGNAFYQLERVHSDSYLLMQDLQISESDISFALPTITSLQEMEYVNYLETVLPEFSGLAEVVATAVKSLTPNSESMTSARHGEPLELLSHLDKQMPEIEKVGEKINSLFINLPSEEDASKQTLHKFLARMPSDYKVFYAANQFLADKEDGKKISAAIRAVEALANTLSGGIYHLENIIEQSSIFTASVTKTKLAMCELYLAVATQKPELAEGLISKARALFDATMPANGTDAELEKVDKKWEKIVEGVRADKDNPYLVFQKHKNLIRTGFEGQNNLSGSLGILSRHTNQSKGALSLLSDMLSADPSKGSFVRDSLPEVKSVIRDIHIDNLIRELSNRTIPFALSKGRLSVQQSDLASRKGELGKKPAKAFLDFIMPFMQNPANDVQYNGTHITLSVDSGKGTSERAELKLAVDAPMPNAMRVQLERLNKREQQRALV